MFSLFNYKIEFRNNKNHANIDALSRLSLQEDSKFDAEESKDDTAIVCQIQTIDEKVNPAEQGSLAKRVSKRSNNINCAEVHSKRLATKKVMKEQKCTDSNKLFLHCLFVMDA